MGKKVPVVVMVDPETGVEIKPFAAELAKAPKVTPPGAKVSLDTTGTVTATYNNGNWDGDGTID